MIPLLIIFGVLLLILLLPVGATAHYDGKATIQLAIGPIRMQLVPAKPKTRKQLEKAKRKKEKKAAKKAEKKIKAQAAKLVKPDPPPKPKAKEPLKDKIQGLLPFAKLAVDTLGSVFRKLKIRQLRINVRFGGGDPAKLAQEYGRTQAAVSAMLPVLGRRFRVKRSQISLQPDFLSTKTEVDAYLSFRFLVGDLLGIGLKAGFRGLKLLLTRKKQQKLNQENMDKQEKAVEE